MNIDNIDKFGFCVMCHKNLITKRIVDGQVIEMFMPIHDHTDFLLNNGSMMKVCICKPCKESNDLSDPIVHSNIMDAVYKGWELETNIALKNNDPHWTIEKRDKYLGHMSKLCIDCNSDNLDKNVIQDKIKTMLNLPVDAEVINGTN